MNKKNSNRDALKRITIKKISKKGSNSNSSRLSQDFSLLNTFLDEFEREDFNANYILLAPEDVSRFSKHMEVDDEEEEDGEEEDNEENSGEPAEDSNEYEVEKLEQKLIYNGVVKFETKWKGYSADDNTFETLDNLENSLQLVKNHELMNINKKQKVKQLIDKNKPNKKPRDGLTIRDIIAFYPDYGCCFVTWKSSSLVTVEPIEKIKRNHPHIFIQFMKKYRHTLINI